MTKHQNVACFLLGLFLGTACNGPLEPDTDTDTDTDVDTDTDTDTDTDVDTDTDTDTDTDPLGYAQFVDEVQPALVDHCAECHLGGRFAFMSLARSGEVFTTEESAENYQTMLDLISLDTPIHSRLLAKVVPEDQPESIQHAGGPFLDPDDETYGLIMDWILLEKEERCPECGPDTPLQYLAYVEAPILYWALDRAPVRADRGLRDGQARIMLQPIDPESFAPMGEPIDFLGDQLCNEEGACDFGHLSVNHAGDQMVFECRLPLEEGDEWVNEVNWNLCIAEISSDGKAENPRFLMPPERRHRGRIHTRGSPFGLYTDEDLALKGVWDHHFQVRKINDFTPVFSPDDQRVYFSSRGPNPRTGKLATRTYHGFEFVNNIVSVKVDGSEPKITYVNEGGQADFPTFLRDGHLAIHVWNLERMDQHLYIRTTPDGQMETPPLFGRFQGVNMWGKAHQLSNGLLLGMTGRRRGAVELWQPFIADHTLGTGFEEGLTSFALLDPENDTHDSHFSYCKEPPDGQNCVVDRFYADPTWSPDGRAFIALNPERTYVTQGDAMYGLYSTGSTTEERLVSLEPYLPKNMGIWLLDHQGNRELFADPPEGKLLRYPAWVGPRHPPRQREWVTDESKDTATLHIANVPIWMSFRRNNDGENKTRHFDELSKIVSLRVLVKVLHGNDCTLDGRPYRNAVHHQSDHPTHLGLNNATGYERLVISEDEGGDSWGDIPLEPDGSVNLVLPAGELLLFQGVDANGHVIRQHARVFAMPPGHEVDTGVKASQYGSQCSSCHGVIGDEPFVGLQETASLPAEPMDFNTDAAAKAPVDLASATATRQPMTFLHQLRDLLDTHCVRCHSGTDPAGELSLESTYSSVGNYPAGRWVDWVNADVATLVPESERVPAYNFSVPYSVLLHDDNVAYKEADEYKDLIASHTPTGPLAPWDPAYQNLFAYVDGDYRYLGGDGWASHYGRADFLGGNSHNAWLIEILTGRNLHPEKDFTGEDHTGFLSETEVRLLQGIMDVGLPFMTRCDDKTIPSGPNTGQPWGDPAARAD